MTLSGLSMKIRVTAKLELGLFWIFLQLKTKFFELHNYGQSNSGGTCWEMCDL